MASQQQNIAVAAPGFGGLNTELSPTEQNTSFAARADNCVIDRFGRIASRKGFTAVSTNNTAYGGAPVEIVHEAIMSDGTRLVFTAAGADVFVGEGTPVNITPGPTPITDDNWQIVDIRDRVIFVQEGHTPLVYVHPAATIAESATVPAGGCVLAAYGRTWVGEGSTVHWSDHVDPTLFLPGGTSGSLDISDYWPTGFDEIQGLAAHNGRLIIFGRDNIVVYSGAGGDAAQTLQLEDTVRNIGCIARDTIQVTGSDVYFLDKTGVRSLARTIQEKSLPIGEVSGNVRTDLLAEVAKEEALRTDGEKKIRACFYGDERMYVLILPETGLAYWFSTALLDERGTARATKWPSVSVRFAYAGRRRMLCADNNALISKYFGADDLGESFVMRYYTNTLSFGDSTKLKMPKQVDLTLLSGAGGAVTLYWAYDYSTTFTAKSITLAATGAVPEYGTAEYGEAEYSGGISLARKKANVRGSGVVVQIGLEVPIAGEAFSLQELNIQALLGRQV